MNNMTGKSEQICQMCSKTIHDNSYKILEGDNKQILEVLLLQVNIESNGQCVACMNCLQMLQKCFEFKSYCVDVEDYISPFIEDGRKIDIRQMLQKNVKIIVDKDIKLCRLCIDIIKDDNCTHLDRNESKDLLDDIRNCLPELKINAVYDPLICEKCTKCLKEYRSFQKKCREINIFNESNKLDISGRNNERIKSNRNFKNVVQYNDNSKDNRIRTRSVSSALQGEVRTYSCEKAGQNKNDANSKEESKSKRKRKYRKKHSSEKKVYKCDMCDFKSHYKSWFKIHSLVHKNLSETDIYKCNDCEFKTKWKKSLVLHVLTHKNSSQVKTHKCTTCNFSTKYKSSLNAHKLTHSGRTEKKLYKCAQCDYATHSECKMRAHIFSRNNSCKADTYTNGNQICKCTNGNVKKIYKCIVCDYTTRYKNHFQNHVVHNKVPSVKDIYRCNDCEFKSNWRASFLNHLLTHKSPSQVKMHKCTICNYTSKYRSNLHTHKLRHPGVTKKATYKCGECNYSTRLEFEIQSHISSQDNSCKADTYTNRHQIYKCTNGKVTKIYKCNVCGLVTHNKWHLKGHRALHKDLSEADLYKCKECNFKTKWKTSLYRHLFIHTN